MAWVTRLYRWSRTFERPFPYYGKPLSGRSGWLVAVSTDHGETWGVADLPFSPDEMDVPQSKRFRSAQAPWSEDEWASSSPIPYARSVARAHAGYRDLAMDIPVSALILLGQPEAETSFQARWAEGYRVFKIKPGHPLDVGQFDFIPALQGATFRIDPNRQWDPAQLTRVHERLLARGIRVTYYEEPCSSPAMAGATGAPLALDESLTPGSLERYRQDGFPRGTVALVHKAGRLGSFHQEEGLYALAEAHGLPVVLSHNLESEAGTRSQVALHAGRVSRSGTRAMEAVGLDSLRFFSNPVFSVLKLGPRMDAPIGPLPGNLLESLDLERVDG